MKEFLKGPMPFLCIGHSFDHMLILLFATVVVVGPLGDEFGMSYGQLVGLAWLGFILFGAGAPLAGWLADRWSSVGTMTLFFLGIGGAAVLAGVASSPWEIGIALSAIGLFASWLGTLCWNAASQRLPTALAGQLIVFETLAALSYAFWLRGQWPEPLTLAGIALLVAGVIGGVRVKAETAETD